MDRPDPAARMVTISATYGAGGSVIGPQLAYRLGLPFADRLIPAEDVAVPEPGTEALTDEERRQGYRVRFLARLAHLTGGLGLPVPPAEDLADPVRERVEHSIHELLRTGGAVVLGRAAAVVLAGHPRAFHVRLDGPEGRRLERALAIEGADGAIARARLHEADRARARYVERLYGVDPADPRYYHIVLDSTVFTIDTCVQLLGQAATEFWRRPASPSPAPSEGRT